MEYRPLNNDLNEIRLLTIFPIEDILRNWIDRVECTLQHVSGREKGLSSSVLSQGQDLQASAGSDNDANSYWGDFVALSYAWGDPNDTRPIYVNGYRTYVTKNLEAALRHLRVTECEMLDHDKGSPRLWVDALCINQSDVDERNQQVKRMRSIYTKATIVIAWLGSVADESEKAMKFIKRVSVTYSGQKLHQPVGDYPDGPEFLGDGIARSVYELFERKYWQRLWVLQEIAVGNVVVFCGHDWASWDYFTMAGMRLSNNWQKFIFHLKYDTFRDQLTYRRFPLSPPALMDLCRREVVKNGAMKDIPKLIKAVRELQTTDPRDKVYSVLGLIDPDVCTSLKPNYTSSVRDIFLAFTEQVIKVTESLEILRAVDLTSVSISLPSWVPNLESPLRANIIGHYPHDYKSELSCCGMLEPTVAFSCREKLYVKAILLDAVIGLGSVHAWDQRLYGDEISNPFITQSTRSENVYGNSDAIREALWKTLLTGVVILVDGHSIDFQKFKLPARVYSITELQTTEQQAEGDAHFMSSLLFGNHDLKIFGMQLLPLLCTADDGDPINQSLIEHLMTMIVDVGRGRRLVITRNGYLGLVPAHTCTGDVIAILPGCSTPMILRRSGEEFVVVGDSYIHGIMYGEAVADVQSSIDRLEPLALI